MDKLDDILNILHFAIDDFDFDNIPVFLHDYYKGILMGYRHCVSLIEIFKKDECD